MPSAELPESFSSVGIAENATAAPETDLLNAARDAYSSARTESHHGTTPALPPALADIRGKSGTEILADLNKLPLFMTDLEENEGLEALRALAYEGTPLEVAAGFKERGNECFREKGWRDAKEFYGKGIDVLLVEVRKRQAGAGISSKLDGEGKGKGAEEDGEKVDGEKVDGGSQEGNRGPGSKLGESRSVPSGVAELQELYTGLRERAADQPTERQSVLQILQSAAGAGSDRRSRRCLRAWACNRPRQQSPATRRSRHHQAARHRRRPPSQGTRARPAPTLREHDAGYGAPGQGYQDAQDGSAARDGRRGHQARPRTYGSYIDPCVSDGVVVSTTSAVRLHQGLQRDRPAGASFELYTAATVGSARRVYHRRRGLLHGDGEGGAGEGGQEGATAAGAEWGHGGGCG
ncbi:hypothetical protein QTJ16_001435 [Diplocarpon rosae]|uniref:Uncharacterized protein n=1 Tax=Diplocarpon rosae TaxID=946125 RepID=A0AAD9WGI8_9HELO|nr:hypothetical protein QTJ16_001435 [Diplocarpon rosae]